MTSTMSRWVLTGALALGAIGGFTPDAATAEAAPNVSPFAGSWSGTYVGGEHHGTLDWTISDVGVITGTFRNTAALGGGGTWRGRVREDGKLMLLAVRTTADPEVVGCFPYQGTAVIGDDGILVATYSNAWSVDFTEVATLERI